jgi:hypothetical protein
VSEKLGTGRYQRWSELDDLLAYTIVVPAVSHEAKVVEWLDTVFNCVGKRGRASGPKAPDVFRFDATRWYGTVAGDPTPPGLSEEDLAVAFEVQIRTAFDDAWASVTHALVYKGRDVDWRQKRLAAQLKAVVEQVDVLIDTFEASASDIPEWRDWRTDAQAEVVRVVGQLVHDGVLDEQLEPESWQRFAESVFELSRRYAGFRDKDSAAFVHELMDGFDDEIRSGKFAVASSASLVHAVVVFALRHHGEKGPKRFPLVWDDDLRGLYGGIKPPAVIDLDA